jgi:hypothetical protein
MYTELFWYVVTVTILIVVGAITMRYLENRKYD